MKTLNILIVDDEIETFEIFDYYLSKEGHTIENALNGEEAIKKVQERSYDLIFMDMVMPGLSGTDTMKEIKKIKPDQHIIFMTGQYDHGNPIKKEIDFVLSGGNTYHLYKPFNDWEIKRVIQRASEKQGLADDTADQ